MIKIKNLRKGFINNDVLEDVNISISSPGIYVIVGQSGCGKSTLINILGLMDNDFEGEYLFFNKDIKELSNKEKELIRFNQIGYIYQNPKFLENESILVNVEIALSKKIKKEELVKEMKRLNLNMKINKKVSLLSGGERKRLSILISLLKDAPLLLCDEITVGLDEENKILVMDRLVKLSRRKIIILVTHDVSFIKRYANNIYCLENKELTILNENEKINECKNRKNNKLTNKFLAKHVFNHIKEKSGRTLLCSMCMMIALISFGFSMLLTSSLSDSITSSLNSSINDHQIVVSKKENIALLNKNESLSKIDISYIKKRYHQYFEFEGVKYMNDFSLFFKDEEYFTLNVNNKYINLKNYDINKINEFKYFSEEDEFIYTYNYDLQEDEIVLGLTINQVYTFCNLLNIEYINEMSLLEYFKDNYLEMSINLRNDDWQYEICVPLKVKGYYVSSEPIIYHTNSLWNEYIIEEVLQLLYSYSLDVIDEIPWTTKKVLYFSIKNNKEMNFIYSYLSDKNMDDYQYGIFKDKDKINVYFLYRHDKGFTKSSLDNMLDEQLISYNACSSKGYNVIPNALLQGFSYPTYISNEYKLLEEYIDYNSYSSSNLGEYQSTILNSTNDKLLSLNILDSSKSNFVSVKTYINESEKIKGKYPLRYNDVIFSSGLLKRMNLYENNEAFSEKQVYFLTLKEIEYANGKYKNDFVIENINITGVIEDENEYLYVPPFWCNCFLEIILERRYKDYFVEKAVFEYIGDDIEGYMEMLNNKYPKYLFENPFLDYKRKIDETISYINLGLGIFSSFCLISSLLMVIISSYLFVIDTKKEIGIYTFYGYQRKSIEKQFKLFGTLLSLYSSFLSSVALVLIMEMLNTGMLGIKVPYNLKSGFSIFLINVIALIIGDISSYFSTRSTLKESPLQQLQEN